MPHTRAFAALSATSALAPFSVDRREPGPNDVAISIKYCGVCHSDIHQTRDGWGGSIFPMVPGHEIVGEVARVGASVTRFKAGDTVGVGCMVDSCRTCESCRKGLEQYCLVGMTPTYNGLERDGKTLSQGGYSQSIVVDQAFVLRIPDTLDLAAAAPLLCAGITLYSPLRHWHAGPGKKVAIVGLGGLGHMGVKLAHAMGADHYYATSDPATFTKLDRSFDLIISTVSADVDWNQYLGLLRLDGTMTVVGVPEVNMAIAPFAIIMGRRSLAGSGIGGIQETQEMLDFCGTHGIVSEIELIGIQQINEAYERVIKSDVRYRFVIDMASLTA